MKKKKSIVIYFWPVLFVVLAATVWLGAKQVSAAVQRLEKIEAYYTGPAVEVGKEIDLKNISVTAQYFIQDGQTGYPDFVQVKKGFTITPSVITNSGMNQIMVTYQGKSCMINVPGKTVENIMASYVGEQVFVGAPVPVGKVEVYAYFSDGSYTQVRDFTLMEPTVTKEGINSIPVTYKGKTVYIQVYGKAPLAVERLLAVYSGNSVIVGSSINKSNFTVTAFYNDGTSKAIKNFNISPSKIEHEGLNEIEVSYGEVSTTVYVTGEARRVTEMEAKYTGGGVIVGKTVNKNEVEVIVTYNDGSKEQVEDYQMYGNQILFEGENIVIIYYDAFIGEIIVPGVKGFTANFDNAITCHIASGDYKHRTEVTLGMNMEVEPNKFLIRPAESEMVGYMVRRVISTEEYIGFELLYDDDEMVLEFPMAMKVTVPEGFDPEHFGVYYTPNKATIMAKVNGDFVDETKKEFEFVVYEPGAYILVHEVSSRLVTDIVVETELKLRVNRSFSLNPVVLPLSAENKDIIYYSTDEEIATVSENGKIRTHAEGTCEIWIEAQDDSGVYAVVTVTVKNGK